MNLIGAKPPDKFVIAVYLVSPISVAMQKFPELLRGLLLRISVPLLSSADALSAQTTELTL